MFIKGSSRHTMKRIDYILHNQIEVLQFLKSRFPMYHLSNFFFRDIQYGILMFLREKGVKVSYPDAEIIARAFVESLEQSKIFRPVDAQSWTVMYPEFRTPPVRKDASAKPSAPAAASQPAPARTGE